MTGKDTCRIVRGNGSYEGRQSLTYFAGISAESVGARGICMHLLRMPPGARAKAHLHEVHETAIFVLSGQAGMWYGDQLEHHRAGRAHPQRLNQHPQLWGSDGVRRQLHLRV